MEQILHDAVGFSVRNKRYGTAQKRQRKEHSEKASRKGIKNQKYPAAKQGL